MDNFSFDMKKSALLIVDMQNAFIHPNGSLSKMGISTIRPLETIESIHQLREVFQVKKRPVIYIQHIQDHTDSDGNLNCREGSWDSQIIDELKPEDGDYCLQKNHFNSIYHSSLEELLSKLAINQLVVTGLTTNICMECSVKDSVSRNIKVVIPKEASASFALEEKGRGPDLKLDEVFAKVTSVKDLIYDILVRVI